MVCYLSTLTYSVGGNRVIDIAMGLPPAVVGHSRMRFTPQTQHAVEKTARLYAEQALPSRMGPGVAAEFGLGDISGVLKTVMDLISGMCGGVGSANAATAMQTAQAMKSPTPLQNSLHWQACVTAVKAELVDSRLQQRRKAGGFSKREWRAMKNELKEARYDMTRRVFNANVEAAQEASLQELEAMVVERRSAA